MADNTVLNSGSGGDTSRSKDRTGVKTQIIAIDLNPAGSETLMSGAMPVTDNAGSLTVDGTVGISGTVTVDSELTTADLDTGAGTDTRAVVGMVLAASGGGLLVGSANPLPISDNSGSITVDNGGTFATQASQSGTWTVQPGNTANTTAWLVTGTGGTFPATQSGTWNVGTVTAVTTVSTVTSVTAIANALPAGTNLLGRVSSSLETGNIYNGTTALTPKFAIITASSSGATTVVAAVTSKKIRVLRWRVSANGSVNVKWQSHVTPTDLSGLSYGTQYKDCGGGFCPVGHFETVSGEALDINLSAAVAVSGELTYVEI